jgi:kumamolisin
MAPSSDRVIMPGTGHADGAQRSRNVRPDECGKVDLYLRRRSEIGDPASYGRTRPFLSRQQFAELHGAREDDMARAREFAAANGLEVAEVDPVTRRVRLTGPWEALGKAFGTTIEVIDVRGEEVYRNACELSLPSEFAPAVGSVLGFDTTPMRHAGTWTSGGNSLAITGVIQQYQFPTLTPSGDACDGTGETIALLEFGAGFSIIQFQAKFAAQNQPAPRVHVRNDLLTAEPGTSGSNEALGDAAMVGSAAPGALIVIWLCDDCTPTNLQSAILAAAQDTREPASVISISYGTEGWSSQDRSSVDGALSEAATLGATCIGSSGDTGGTDPNGPVQCPAECPHALAVGGTVIEADGSEVVWNDQATGMASTGGFSDYFPAPAWQPPGPASNQYRGVPDVSAHADSYDLGNSFGIGWTGTSNAAPLWAALIARLNQIRLDAGQARFGLIAPDLYAHTAAVTGTALGFTDITVGDNGIGTNVGYPATAGWDAATGLGSPLGTTLAQNLVSLTTLKVMKVTVTPSPVKLAPATATFTVNASDQVTGVGVQGTRVFLNDQLIGEAGTSISQTITPLNPPLTWTIPAPLRGLHRAEQYTQKYPSVLVCADGYQPVSVALGPPEVKQVTLVPGA